MHEKLFITTSKHLTANITRDFIKFSISSKSQPSCANESLLVSGMFDGIHDVNLLVPAQVPQGEVTLHHQSGLELHQHLRGLTGQALAQYLLCAGLGPELEPLTHLLLPGDTPRLVSHLSDTLVVFPPHMVQLPLLAGDAPVSGVLGHHLQDELWGDF